MKIKAIKTERLQATITADEVREIIRTHLVEKHGVSVQPNEIHFVIKTVYDGTMGDPGSDEFTGVDISSVQNKQDLEL
jgi:hypothetical protein